jgi:hypothetical protein
VSEGEQPLDRHPESEEELVSSGGAEPDQDAGEPAEGDETRETETDEDAEDHPEGVVVSLLAPDVEGDYAVFVSLEDGLLLVEQYQGSSDLTGFAETVERRLPAPYRARAMRVDRRRFVVVARGIETIELPGLEGEELFVVALPNEQRVAVLDGKGTTLPPSDLDGVLDESEPCLARLTNLDEAIWELSLELL